MVLACGPRLSPESLYVLPGITIKGYVPNLYEHFAARDFVVVMGRDTSILELTALTDYDSIYRTSIYIDAL